MTGAEAEGVAGFSLLELLVAMTLLGLVTVGLTGGIRFGATVWERAQTRHEAVGAQQAAYGLLHRTLRRLTPVSLSQEPSATTVTFIGEPSRFRLVGGAPARSAPPGLYRIEFAITPDAGGSYSLVVRWEPLAGRRLPTPMDEADTRILLSGIGKAAFAYFGTREAGWVGDWGGRVDLPQLVRLDIDDGPVPSLFGRAIFPTFLGVPEP